MPRCVCISACAVMRAEILGRKRQWGRDLKSLEEASFHWVPGRGEISLSVLSEMTLRLQQQGCSGSLAGELSAFTQNNALHSPCGDLFVYAAVFKGLICLLSSIVCQKTDLEGGISNANILWIFLLFFLNNAPFLIYFVLWHSKTLKSHAHIPFRYLIDLCCCYGQWFKTK